MKKILEQWFKCLGCNTMKTINFKQKEKEKQFICECGKHSLVKNKVI